MAAGAEAVRMTPKSQCEVCGFRLGIDAAWAYLDMCVYYANNKKLRMRWPRRQAVMTLCPECGHKIILAQQVSRDVVEFA